MSSTSSHETVSVDATATLCQRRLRRWENERCWRRFDRRSGFSLVEILLVILILLMLAGALVVYVLPQQEGAQRNTTRLKLSQLDEALATYKLNIGTFPSEEEGGLRALMKKPQYENEKLAEKWVGPYLKPGTTLDDAWNQPIQYEKIDKSLLEDKSGPDYRLFSVGPDGQPDTDDDIKLFSEEEETGSGGDTGVLPPPPVSE